MGKAVCPPGWSFRCGAPNDLTSLVGWLETRTAWIHDYAATGQSCEEFAAVIHTELHSSWTADGAPETLVTTYATELIRNVRCWLDHRRIHGQPQWTDQRGNPRELIVADDHLSAMLAFLRSVASPATAAEQSEEAGGELSPEEKRARLAKLKPSERQAYWAFKYAEGKKGKALEDREAHADLLDYGIEGAGLGELEDYKPPNLQTFQRQLGAARKALGEQKYSRRAGRPYGGSIARGRDVESQTGDDE